MKWFWQKIKDKFTPKPKFSIMDFIRRGICPDCGSTNWFFGPHGGGCQNIECAECHSRFNVAPFDDGWCGPPMLAERIGTLPWLGWPWLIKGRHVPVEKEARRTWTRGAWRAPIDY